MRIRIRKKTLTALESLMDTILFNPESTTIMIIREVEHEVITEEKKARKGYFVRKSDDPQKQKVYIYLTKLTLTAYHGDGEFIGTFDEKYVEKLLQYHEWDGSGYSLYKFRKEWVDFRRHMEGMGIKLTLPKDTE